MAKKNRASITGVGGYLPKYILTNQELETMVDTNDEWITTRTGIKERRILKPEEGRGASYLGVKAVQELLEKTNTKPEEVDLIICGTVTGDRVFPDTANTISDIVGMKNAFGFDINAACSGFLYSLSVGAKFVESGTHKKVIVVGVDVMSSIVDYTDRSTCIIFGDGAGAVMLEPSEDAGIIDAVLKADGSGREFLHIKSGGSYDPISVEAIERGDHKAFQDGRPVFKAAVKGMVAAIEELLERNNLTIDDIQWLVPHQANKRIISSVGKMIKIPDEKVMVNIEKYGNTTSGTLPLCLWDYEKEIKSGDLLILTAFGGGFTWGATLIKWA